MKRGAWISNDLEMEIDKIFRSAENVMKFAGKKYNDEFLDTFTTHCCILLDGIDNGSETKKALQIFQICRGEIEIKFGWTDKKNKKKCDVSDDIASDLLEAAFSIRDQIIKDEFPCMTHYEVYDELIREDKERRLKVRTAIRNMYQYSVDSGVFTGGGITDQEAGIIGRILILFKADIYLDGMNNDQMKDRIKTYLK